MTSACNGAVLNRRLQVRHVDLLVAASWSSGHVRKLQVVEKGVFIYVNATNKKDSVLYFAKDLTSKGSKVSKGRSGRHLIVLAGAKPVASAKCMHNLPK